MIRVEFRSPGTIVAETDEAIFPDKNISRIYQYSQTIKQRYGATPYAFRIFGEKGWYFLNCKIETIEDVRQRKLKEEETLLWNMETNHLYKIAKATKGYSWTTPYSENDFNIIEVNGEIQITQ